VIFSQYTPSPPTPAQGRVIIAFTLSSFLGILCRTPGKPGFWSGYPTNRSWRYRFGNFWRNQLFHIRSK